MEATQDTGAFVQLSGVLKRVAVKLSKTCNDLRLLSSGPRAGLNDRLQAAFLSYRSNFKPALRPFACHRHHLAAQSLRGQATRDTG